MRPLLILPTVWAFIACATTTPAADCRCTVRVNCSTLSHDSVTCSGSPEVSSITFHAQPPDLPPVPLMDMGFVVLCRFARHRRPQIQFLSIGSRVCSALLSDLVSRLGPCVSLSLHVHHVVKRTFTSKLSIMLGTQNKATRLAPCRSNFSRCSLLCTRCPLGLTRDSLNWPFVAGACPWLP